MHLPPSPAGYAASGIDHVEPLAPAEQTTIANGMVRIHAERATHQGNRYGVDRWRSAANMYLCETNDESLFFAGDTALTPDTHALVERVLWKAGRELDVALLPIGYAPPWKPGFRRGHLTHDDALDALRNTPCASADPLSLGHVSTRDGDGARRDQSSAQQPHVAQSEGQVHIIEPGESIVVPPSAST